MGNIFGLPIDLQLFAEDPPTDPPSELPKTLDEILKDKSLQSEFDKRIAKALETARGKWELDFEVKLAEAVKTAKMNEDQKTEYGLEKREADITRRELRAKAYEAMAAKGLPRQLVDILMYTSVETYEASLEAVESAFRQEVEAIVNQRLKGDPPKSGKGTSYVVNNPWSAKHFNLTEQGRIAKENPQQARQLKAAAKHAR